MAKSWTLALLEYAKLNLEADLSDLISVDQVNSKKIDVYVASVKQIVLPVSFMVIDESIINIPGL